MGALAQEDFELDRELAKITAEREMDAAPIPYNDAPVIAEPQKMPASELRELVKDYQPAANYSSLQEQILLARAKKCDTIEAEDVVFRAVFGEVPDTCYAMIKGVKVYRVGMVKKGRELDARSADAGLFGLMK